MKILWFNIPKDTVVTFKKKNSICKKLYNNTNRHDKNDNTTTKVHVKHLIACPKGLDTKPISAKKETRTHFFL